jgi:hypothetical protein
MRAPRGCVKSGDRLADQADMTVLGVRHAPAMQDEGELIFDADGCNAREGSLAKYAILKLVFGEKQIRELSR